MLRPFLIISFVSGTSAAFAGPVQLTGEDLNKTLRGALIEMDTPLGTKIPVRFGADGLVSGEAGELAPLLGSARDRGRWWIDGNRICSKWFRWFDAEPQCLSVRQDGTRLFWREDGGKTGTATLVEGPPAEKPAPAATVVAKADAAAPSQLAVKSPPAAAAKADATEAQPTPPAVAKASAEPLPLPVRAPARAQEVRVAEAEDPPEADVAVETASVAHAASASEGISDIPMMRFGGAGLLEASARISRAEAPEEVDAPPAPAEASDANAKTRVAALPQAERAAPAPESKARRIETAVETVVPTPAAAKDARPPRDPWTSAPSIRAPGFYRVRGVGRRDVLNVRRGPSESHAAVATIPPTGRRIEITGACQGEWCPIRYRNTTGWVHSFYLADELPRRGSASRVYLAQP